MKLIFASGLVVLAITSALGARHEAPAGFDPRGNGMVDEATHQADQNSFDEVETVEDGLGQTPPPVVFQ